MDADESTLRELLDSHYLPLVGAIALVVDSRPAAEDAVQEALVRLWERLERGEHIESPKAWATRTAMNLARSSMRRFRAERRALSRLPEHQPPSFDPASADLATALRLVVLALIAAVVFLVLAEMAGVFEP